MVKYADGPTTSVVIHIDAPPSAVWPIVCDINAPAEFSPEFQGAEWTSDGPALGATFEGRNKHERVGEWSVPCTITAFDVEERFEWVVGDLDEPSARWRFDLEPTDEGCTLRFTSRIGPGRSGLTPAIERMPDREDDIVANRMAEHHANMGKTVEGYKHLAEAAA